MAVILITPEELKGKANEVMGYKTEYEDTINKLTNLVMGLSETWKGEAQVAFQDKFNSMKPQFTNFGEMLKSYADLMIQAADKMQETDVGLKNAMQSSFT